MTANIEPFRILEGEEARLSERPTRVEPAYASKADYRRELDKRVRQISGLQRKLYAASDASLLVILQAPDSGGKDGAIRHVFSGVNPQGCEVHNFEPPSSEELRHDFLWRTVARLPAHGLIGVFNRSYYEEVVVVRVHPGLLAAEGLGGALRRGGFWDGRLQSIRDHEAHLARNRTQVVKVYLHLSRDEQRRRLLRRIARPDKHWKLDPADISERDYWDDYTSAYEACLTATSTDAAPWYVVPADDKKTARVLVAEIVLQALARLRPADRATTP